ncbi:MAG: alpha/beta hydrolase, partial [bacterium]|nr:alpha/beta hydrolase [bacterium]
MKLLRVIVLLCICVFLVALPLAAESKTTSGTVKSADGVAISYEMMGTGSPTLVFIHGWSCDRTYWREQTAYFAKKYKVVAVDLGGHGQSGLNRDNWTMQAFAGDVSAVIEKLDLKKVILIGHSMGGPVIAETALLIPDRLVALIGVDTFNDVGLIATDKQVNFLMGPMKADFKKGCQFFCRTMFTPKSDRALIDKIANDMSSAPPKIALSAMEELFKNDTLSTIKKI